MERTVGSRVREELLIERPADIVVVAKSVTIPLVSTSLGVFSDSDFPEFVFIGAQDRRYARRRISSGGGGGLHQGKEEAASCRIFRGHGRMREDCAHDFVAWRRRLRQDSSVFVVRHVVGTKQDIDVTPFQVIARETRCGL